MVVKLGHFDPNLVVTESLTTKPTHVLPKGMPGGIVLLEYKLFLNLRILYQIINGPPGTHRNPWTET